MSTCACDFPAGACRDTHCRCYHHGYDPVPQSDGLDVERLAVAMALEENHTMQDVVHGIAGPQTRAQAARYAARYAVLGEAKR